MRYSTEMKVSDLLADGEGAALLEQFAPGLGRIAGTNPQALSLSVEQLLRYSLGEKSTGIIADLDQALRQLGQRQTGPSPEEEKLMRRFREMEKKHRKRSRKSEAHYQTAIYPGRPWLDTKGKRIQAHGGMVFHERGCYYWIGENKEYTDGKNGVWTWGIRYYRSTDLVNWENMGYLIPPVLDDPDSPLFPSKRADRPHLLFCPQSGKYVCWIKLSGPEAAFSIWQADSLSGPYREEKRLYRPEGRRVGDFDLIADSESGKAYLYFDADHSSLVCMGLRPDYLEAEEILSESYPGQKPPFTREAPALFEAEEKKYMFTSGMSGYVPNLSDCAVSQSWEEAFESIGNPHQGDASRASFNSQISKVFRIEGTSQWIAMADRWLPDTPVDGRIADLFTRVIASSYDPARYEASEEERREMYRLHRLESANTSVADYVWLPVKWKDGRPVLEWQEAWTPLGKGVEE